MTGFFGGTFNPVHRGHIELALWLARNCHLDSVWLSLSPANPLKGENHPGATDAQRAEMLRLACEPHPTLRAVTLELEMPRPSYTFNVLDNLSKLHPNREFRLIVGADNWLNFCRWYRAEEIISRFGLIVYPRPGEEPNLASMPQNVTFAASAPQFSVSSTQIRRDIARGADPSSLNMLPPQVARYIIRNKLYGYKPTDQ